MNQPDTFTHELEEQLHALADGVRAPAVPLGDDLARGRTARLRRRLATSGALLAVVAVVGLGAVGIDQLTEDSSSIGPAGGGGGEGVDPAPSASAAPTNLLESYAEPLRLYNDVIASHLDPRREHLPPYAAGGVDVMTNESRSSFGTSFDWTNPSESGTGLLQVEVAPGMRYVFSECDIGWTCRDVIGPGGVTARVGEHQGAQKVAVVHPDGHAVSVSFDPDPSAGTNSTEALTGPGPTQDELIAAAADERLVLPAVE